MNRLDPRAVVIPWWAFWLGVLALVVVVLAVLFFQVQQPKLQALVGGVLGGALVLSFNYVQDIHLFGRLERYQKMGVHRLLSNRHERAYYRRVLENATRSVRCMGTSCSRFIGDFLDVESEDAVLVKGLRQHQEMTVQLLVPANEHMEEQSRREFELMEERIGRLEAEFHGRFEIRRFAHRASHSMVIADDTIIVGPVFEGDKSQHTPAIHLALVTAYGGRCADYFDSRWTEQADA